MTIPTPAFVEPESLDPESVAAALAAEKIRSELGARIARLETYLIGIDGQNGIRGEVKALGKGMEELKDSVQGLIHRQDEYFYEIRRETCYGVKALAEHEESHFEMSASMLQIEDKRQDRREKEKDRRVEDLKSKRVQIAAIVVALVASPILSSLFQSGASVVKQKIEAANKAPQATQAVNEPGKEKP